MNTNNTTKKALSFGKGLTNTPSDFLSTDEELTESVGMILKNEEMMPIQRPALMGELIDEKLCFVHKYNGYVRYITADGTYLYCNKLEDGEFIPVNIFPYHLIVKSAASIGKIVILATNIGMVYLKMEAGNYTISISDIPKPVCNFRFTELAGNRIPTEEERTKCIITDFVDVAKEKKKAYYDSNNNFITTQEKPSDYTTVREFKYITIKHIAAEDQKDFQTAIQGHVAETINWVKKKGFFAYPFFLRYALMLYDGTYHYISAPILCMPCVDRNFRMGHPTYEGKQKRYSISYTDTSDPTYLMYDIKYFDLEYQIKIEVDDFWSDLIQSVVVFASEPVLPFELNGEYLLKDPDDVYNTTVFNNAPGAQYKDVNILNYNTGTNNARQEILPTYKSRKTIREELINTSSRFYKLFEVPIDECDGKFHAATKPLDPSNETAKINETLLSNLTEQEMLSVDDYYGWTKMIPEHIFLYNNRINIIGVKRYPSFSNSVYNVSGGDSNCLVKMFVHITSSNINTWVPVHAVENTWFYYPDPNAKELLVEYQENSDGSASYYKYQLKTHPRLNGAYFFDVMVNTDAISKSVVNYPAGHVFDTTSCEHLDSQIFTSVVNNPFVFQSNGDNTVGTGTILGITANTEPISQGQFGQYPLFVFTTEGIYGLSVDSEGLYAASFPVSREVCNNANSITPTDRLVFFTTEKGLMVISGNTAQCVSTQLQGPTPRNFNVVGDGNFREFLKDCRLAYDYRESLIRIYSPNHDYHYVYSMRDQTFAKASNENTTVRTVVSSYPDSLVQEDDGKVYSLLNKPDINADTNTYSGTFITRPLKFGSSLELKTIHQILHFFNSDEGKMQLQVFGSNDCRTWQELKSLHGKPWLFYVFRYDLSNLKASDSFAGTAIAIETRFNDKMR